MDVFAFAKTTFYCSLGQEVFTHFILG